MKLYTLVKNLIQVLIIIVKELKNNLDNQNQIDMIEQMAQIEILEWVLEVCY